MSIPMNQKTLGNYWNDSELVMKLLRRQREDLAKQLSAVDGALLSLTGAMPAKDITYDTAPQVEVPPVKGAKKKRDVGRNFTKDSTTVPYKSVWEFISKTDEVTLTPELLLAHFHLPQHAKFLQRMNSALNYFVRIGKASKTAAGHYELLKTMTVGA